ncbi:UPF0158 family protein [Clostridium aciditolerans]|uniref:Uncharacterized protein n=1 Tax=Clostridium aciditolerans TaxID=339861 RepID=A0A934M7X7_9CLOT|nr:UPF0158 family protein [Clostridium aciditolerans]MBI6874351.1 hypothetical protein [Clostridium aciditolerans]
MKKLKIDLELLVQSFSFNEDDLAKEYLDTYTGDIINIPSELDKVIQGEQDEEELEQWQRELLKDAYSVKNDEEERYILIPNTDETYNHNIMVSFTKEIVCSENLRDKLLNALNSNQPERNFKNILFEHEAELVKWEAYEEEKAEEYAANWLRKIDIELE